MGSDVLLSQADVSRETIQRLERYESLLKKWQAKINLVAASTLSEIWHRHFLDSYQLQKYIPDHKLRIVDLGSGAGFPGAVLSILGFANVTLIEKDKKKCTFLRNVSRETQAPFQVFEGSIEDYPGKADIIVSRALAPLDKLLSLAYPLINPTGKCLFLKGKEATAEITVSFKNWDMTVERKPSITNGEGVILEISKILPRT